MTVDYFCFLDCGLFEKAAFLAIAFVWKLTTWKQNPR